MANQTIGLARRHGIRAVPSHDVVNYAASEMSARPGTRIATEHVPENAMDEPDEIARFYDRCSDLMRQLLDELAAAPDRPRPFPHIEDALGWPHRRIASVLGGVCHVRRIEFAGRRPYHFHEPRGAASGRWELWMDELQARAIRFECARATRSERTRAIRSERTRAIRSERGP